MKNLKNILAALAFVFAIGSAFAFKADVNPNPVFRKLADQSCQEITNCTSAIQANTCSVTGIQYWVPDQFSNCATTVPTAYQRP